ncbi:MAG: S8 family serine peptidase [Nitrospiraceae bacterium]|nr:S8 family serine peptidase [Nitrospiraceae bacterium]
MRRITRFILPLLLPCIIVSFSHAGVITPELENRMRTGRPSEEIPVIISINDRAALSAIRTKEKSARQGETVRELRAKAETTQARVKAFLGSAGARNILALWINNAVAASVPAGIIDALAAFPEVASIAPDAVITAPVFQNSVTGTPEWNIDRIKAPALWASGLTGAGVVVANMDTGVDVTHPDLAPRYRGGTNSWFDPFRATTSPYDLAGASTGHGTGTMSVMTGGSSGGTAIGVAPGATWIAAKIFNDTGSSTYSVIHSAFQWLLDPDNNPATNDAPDVVNASWGINSAGLCIPEFEPDVAALKAAGIAIVFAAGNSGPNQGTSISPANNPGSFAAGATDINDSVITQSSRGPSACDGSVFPHVAAPGANIRIAQNLGGYNYGTGTSFAAPQVAAAMALLLGGFPALTVPELELLMKGSAGNAADYSPDNTKGYGLIDLQRAYQAALVPAADISVTPASDDFGYVYVRKTSPPFAFSVTNLGLASLVISAVSVSGTDAADFQITTDGCSGAPLAGGAACAVLVSFRPLSSGLRKAFLTIQSNDPGPLKSPLNVPVSGTGLFDTVGIYRFVRQHSMWYLDNINSILDACGAFPDMDGCFGPYGGWSTDVPVTGDWNNSGRTKIGIFRAVKGKGSWYLDGGSGIFDGCGGFAQSQDLCIDSFGGAAGDIPVTGDWNNDGITKIGIYRVVNGEGFWYLDDGTHNFGPIAPRGPFGGLAGDIPVTGDWDGTGPSKSGIYRVINGNGTWLLDNGDGVFNGCGGFPLQDECIGPFGGLPGDIPVVGDANGDGRSEIGIYRVENGQGFWYIDNGTHLFSQAIRLGPFGGLPQDRPVMGHWFR